jgi:hypothetical protein
MKIPYAAVNFHGRLFVSGVRLEGRNKVHAVALLSRAEPYWHLDIM